MDDVAGTLVKRIVWRVIQTRFFNEVRPRICHTRVFQIEGKTKRSNYDLSTLVFAKKEIAHYFSKLSYSEEPEIKYLGKTTIHDIPFIITSTKPDIVFVDAGTIFSEFLLSKEFFVLPYIDFTLDIFDPWDSIYARMDRDKRRRIRKIEKLGYTYEITRDFEKFRLFYYEMYLPHISKRYGKSAQIVSFAEFEKLFRSGGLLLVKLNGKYVSGAIHVIRGKTIYIPILAVREVDEYLAKGASHAPLYFLILWAKQHGFEKIDYGSCNPFLKDGLFLYKKAWGMKIRPVNGQDAKVFAIKFCNFRKATREFLVDNPFIFTDSENLKGLVISDSNAEDLYRTYHVPGLSDLFVLCSTSNTPNSLHRLSLECDSVQISPPLSFLTKRASKRGFDAYCLDFNMARKNAKV